jgi:SAM-dependent methyltransferase
MAAQAVELANAKKGERPIKFEVGDAHQLPYPNDSFDVVLLQSILHHDDSPLEIIREALRVAPEVVIHEPNGLNLGLKVIEQLSSYHREHGEKSYTLRRVGGWIRQAGGCVVSYRYAGFVPMFCPDWLARVMKGAESLVESLPLANQLGCAVYVLVAKRL